LLKLCMEIVLMLARNKRHMDEHADTHTHTHTHKRWLKRDG